MISHYSCLVLLFTMTTALHAESSLTSIKIFSDGVASSGWTWKPSKDLTFQFYVKDVSNIEEVARSVRVEGLPPNAWHVYYTADPKPENLPSPPINGAANQTMLQFLTSVRGQDVEVQINENQVAKGRLLEVEKSSDVPGNNPLPSQFYITVIDGSRAKRIQMGSGGFSISPTNKQTLADLNDVLIKQSISNTSDRRIVTVVLHDESKVGQEIKLSYQDKVVACTLESHVTIDQSPNKDAANVSESLTAQVTNLSPYDWPTEVSLEFVEAPHDSVPEAIQKAHTYKSKAWKALNRLMTSRYSAERCNGQSNPCASTYSCEACKVFVLDPAGSVRWREGIEIPSEFQITNENLVVRDGLFSPSVKLTSLKGVAYSIDDAASVQKDLKGKNVSVFVGQKIELDPVTELYFLKSFLQGRLKYAKGFETPNPKREIAVIGDYLVSQSDEKTFLLEPKQKEEEVDLRTPSIDLLTQMGKAKLVGPIANQAFKTYLCAQLRLHEISANPSTFSSHEAEIRECRTAIEKFLSQH